MDVADTLRLALADRYTIERELGQGGMATVCLPEDLKHLSKPINAMPPLTDGVRPARRARQDCGHRIR